MSFITEEKVRELCPNAENVIVTGDIYHEDIGLKVGLFAQATSVSWQMSIEEQTRRVRDLYMDLVMMNRREQQQHKEAEAANGTRS